MLLDRPLSCFRFGVVQVAIGQRGCKTSLHNQVHDLSDIGNGRHVDEVESLGNRVCLNRNDARLVFQSLLETSGVYRVS